MGVWSGEAENPGGRCGRRFLACVPVFRSVPPEGGGERKALLFVSSPTSSPSDRAPLSGLPVGMTDPSPPVTNDDVCRSTIESIVGQAVEDLSLYRKALTHRSLLRSHPQRHLLSNERLEFLGDAFLDLAISEELYERYPSEDEGFLTRMRAKLVSEQPLARYARHLDLGTHLLMSENAARNDGRNNPSLLADAFEALVGAVYLDLGHHAARVFVRDRALAPFDLAEVAAQDANYKSRLLERMQAEGRSQPTYRVVHQEGPSHDRTFTVEVWVGDTAYERGTASSKQEAEQNAARRTLAVLSAPESAGQSSGVES